MAIQDDFTIDYNNKRIYHSSGTVVYEVNDLYSWLMDTFDEQGAMDNEIPMSAQTPTEYSFINGWFIDDVSPQYLKTGAIKTDGYIGAVEYMKFNTSGYVNAVSEDIGKKIMIGGSTFGVLLDFDNTDKEWWVRDPNTFSAGSTLTIDGGTGAGTLDANGGTFGEKLWANIYTLGTIESGTDVYVYQGGSKITSYWPSGHVDLLVKVKEAGAEIDGANITIFARVWTDLFDNFDIDLTPGGRNAVPLATSNDLDNQTAVGTVLNNLDIIRVMFVGGTLPWDSKAGNDPITHMVIHGQTSHATAYILNAPTGASGTFTLGNIEGTFQNGEVIEICEEIKFDAQTSQFTVGTSIDNGGAASATIRKIVQDPQASGTEGILFVTNVSGTWNDNDPIEEGATQRATQNGAIVTNTFTANTTGTVTFAATYNKDLNNGNGAQPYNVIIDLNGMHVADLYEVVKGICRRTSTLPTFPTNGTTTSYTYNGERYVTANTTYTQLKKASPFATFAGGKFFGARGIWIEDMHADDVMDFSLIDANNVTQDPPIQASFAVSALVAGDRVLVAKTTGDNYTIDKSQFTNVAQGSGVGYVEVSEDLAGSWKDLPTTGTIRVRYNIGLSNEGEDIYTYTSINTTLKRFMLSGTTARAYTTDDRSYVPYVDVEATSDVVTVTVVYQADRYVVARVRKKGIIPFQTKGQFKNTGYSVAAIRTTDAIVT